MSVGLRGERLMARGTGKEATASLTPPPSILERERELSTIDTLLAQARAGEGRLVLVEGVPGIGKTALLSLTAERAGALGLRCLASRGSDLEADFAFGVIRQLFEPALRALEDEERAEALAGDAALCARVVGAETYIAPSRQSSAELFPLLHGLYWLCANLSASRPLLIVIDDAHWADLPSLKFAHYLARRLGELPVMVALAVRSTHPEAPVAVVERIREEPTAEFLALPALSQSASHDLIAGAFDTRPSSEFARACHATSGGNPFLLVELARSLAADRVVPNDDAAADVRDVRSESISRQVLVRLAQLGDEATRLARATAILGPDSEARQVARLAQVPEERAILALDSLVEARVLAPGRPLRFLHPLLQTAVYTDVAAGRRAADHKRAAELIDGDGATPERVAGHLLQAELLGDAWVVDALRAAARSAVERGAPAEACTFLRRALREPPEDPAPVLLELGAAAARAGDPDARDLLRDAVDGAHSDELRVAAVVELGMDLANGGRLEEAATVARRCLAGLDPERKELVRPLEMMVLAMAECSVFARGLGADLIKRAERVVGERGAASPKGLLAIVAFERALVTGSAADAAEVAEQALAGEQLFVEQPVDSAHAYYATAAMAIGGDTAAADRHLGRAIAASRARGSLRGAAFATAMRALVRHQAGELEAAEHDARTFFDLETDAEWNVFRLAAASALADALIDRGDLEGAGAVLGEVNRKVDHVLFLRLRATRARLSIALREPEAALAQLEQCARWERAWGARNPVWCEWRVPAAMAHLLAGDHTAAQRLASEQVARVRQFGSRRALGNALRVEGLVAGGEEGIELLRQATVELERSEARLDHARALADYGAALRRVKHRVESRVPLRAAIDLAHRCGAEPLAHRAGEELRATGARPRRLVLSGIDSLTAREHQVARIAAEGATNREIAQALFVSKKTVETHLGHIYRKLDVSSRAEIAGLLGLKDQ